MKINKIIERFQRKPPNRLIIFLQESPLLEGLNINEVIKMRKILRIHTYKADDIVFTPESKEKGLYIILVGKTQLLKKIRGKRYEPVTELERGEFFGEYSFLNKPLENVIAKASTNLEVFCLSQKEFENLKKTEPKISVKILLNVTRILGERLIKVNADFLENAYLKHAEMQK